jgi:V/A-type H+/Na+-transporting ATPase subunit A
MRVAGGLWALDSALAYRRHYPSVNWNRSYSLYLKELTPWFEKNAPAGWMELRQRIATTLQRDAELQEVVQLVGPDALQDSERLILEVSRMIREVFLQQNAFSDNDAFCGLEKNAGLMDALMAFLDESKKVMEKEIPLQRILDLPVREDIARLRDQPNERFTAKKDATVAGMKSAMAELAAS